MRRIEVSPDFPLLLAGLYCLSSGRLLLAFLLAAGLHEAAHIAVLAACGQAARRLRLTALGAALDTPLLSYRQEFFCALAGPLVNFLLFFLLRRVFPEAALLSLALGTFNLLPIWPLDGGRALSALAARFMSPEEGAVVTLLASGGALTFLCLGALAASWYWRLGVWPLLAAGWAVLRVAFAGRQERARAPVRRLFHA